MSDLGVVGFVGVASALLGLVEPHIVLTAHDNLAGHLRGRLVVLCAAQARIAAR